ncbi:mitochondrial carrier protein, putative [Bodo saltans]|uniref:Mitochondrial carrier protein, putative n=1 Tax=Bodo saltans TaxID=75058 RepID=A0A0S4IWF5_BODSA|nr:mitochondrial carrier protein, putative [Bodo saltans]|eukprot:CUG28398.1 mitochondrial carrier protein, putative [Bodo saltans]
MSISPSPSKGTTSPTLRLSSLEMFVMSGVAAVASKSVLTPLERAKLLLSNQDMSRSPPCHTLSGVLRRSVKEDGLLKQTNNNKHERSP